MKGMLPRFIVFGGLGSALAGNVGWIIWLFIEAVKEHPLEAITPPLIGVLVGVSAEIIHHYISLGSAHEATTHATSGTNRRPWIYAELGVVISAFEHVIAHEIDKVPGAFVNGLLTMIPFEAAIALAFWDTPIHGEMRFRPAGYESHPLYNIDCHLAGWLATGLVIIVILIRLFA